MVQLLLPVVLNIVSLLVTADRCRVTIFKETEQDRKLDIRIYNTHARTPTGDSLATETPI